MVTTRSEIMSILETSGYEVRESERNEMTDNNIVVDFPNESIFTCNDSVGLIKNDVQITFFTKNIREKNAIRLLIYKNFNATSTTKYLDDDEWWNVVYIVQVVLSDI